MCSDYDWDQEQADDRADETFLRRVTWGGLGWVLGLCVGLAAGAYLFGRGGC